MGFLGNTESWYELFREGVESAPKWFCNVTESKLRFNKVMATLQSYSLIEAMPGRLGIYARILAGQQPSKPSRSSNRALSSKEGYGEPCVRLFTLKSIKERRHFYFSRQPLIWYIPRRGYRDQSLRMSHSR